MQRFMYYSQLKLLFLLRMFGFFLYFIRKNIYFLIIIFIKIWTKSSKILEIRVLEKVIKWWFKILCIWLVDSNDLDVKIDI